MSFPFWAKKSFTTVAAFALFMSCAIELCAQEYTFTTLAGPDGGPGWFDGSGADARFASPRAIARDSSGSLYVADRNRTIRKITPSGEVSTLAGLAETIGYADGDGSAARFVDPLGVAVDASGNVFVAEAQGHVIRKITPAGKVSTIAGVYGAQGCDDGSGSAARFASPVGIAVDDSGNLYVSEYWNHTIRKISTQGNVTTLAGLAGVAGTEDGTGSEARFDYPMGIAIDNASGTIYVADSTTIRKVTAAGIVTTLAGAPRWPGGADGSGAAARFNRPAGLAIDASGNVYVADSENHAVRKVDSLGAVTTVAGLAGNPGMTDGAGSTARLSRPLSIVVDSDGNAFVADSGNNAIRSITSAGVVTTFAGKPSQAGSGDGAGTLARFRGPDGIAVDPSGNVYVADSGNCTIRKITAAGVVSTLAGSPGSCGSADGEGDGARFHFPDGIALDAEQNVYVADTYNHTIRKVTPGGVVTTLAGSPGAGGSVDGPGIAARFHHPRGVAVDSDGNVFVADSWSHAVRKVTPAGEVSTIAGILGVNGTEDGGLGEARFFLPHSIAFDSSGNAYVAEAASVRKITPEGDVTTIAAGGSPTGITVGSDGTVYFSDSRETIRVLYADGASEIVGGADSQIGSADGTGTAARFSWPQALAISSNGDLFVAERDNNRIRVGRRALPGAASIDNPPGHVGAEHHLSFSGAATSYAWRVTRRPAGSSALPSSLTDSAPTFVPDVNDDFEIQLVASDGDSTYIGRTRASPPSLAASWASCYEHYASTYLQFGLSEALAYPLTVDWSTQDGSAIAGFDYVAASGSLIFAAGDTSHLVWVQILEDGMNEYDESFSVGFESVAGVQNGGQAIVTIVDNEPAPTLTINDVSLSEGDAGTSDAVFTVTLAGSTSKTINCTAVTTVGTATAGTDFSSVAGVTLKFLPGETTKTVTVSVFGDQAGEGDETFFVDLITAPGAAILDAQGVGTIVNDDLIVGDSPSGLTANAASPTSIQLSWNEVAGATGYVVSRKSGGSAYVQIGAPATSSLTDNSASPGTSYLYKVRATDGPIESVDSAAELATAILFTDPTLTPGVTKAKSVHVTELRTAVNAVRQLAGLAPGSFTDPGIAAGATIRAIHVSELRSALVAARALLGLSPLTLTDPTVSSEATRVKAAHVTELRDGVR